MLEKIRAMEPCTEVINYGAWQEVFFSSDFKTGKKIEDFLPIYERLVRLVQDECSGIINEKIYCSRYFFERIQEIHNKIWRLWYKDNGRHAFSCLEGMPLENGEVAGFQIRAFKLLNKNSCNIDSAASKDYSVFLIGWNGYKICYLTGLKGGLEKSATKMQREMCAYNLLFQAFQILSKLGFKNTEIVHTWFYLDKIDKWYNNFNQARSSVFKKIGLIDTKEVLPASTGIGIYSGKNSIVAIDAVAVKCSHNQRLMKRLYNPIQKEAPEYDSLFSRGISIDFGSSKVIYVSGTASIGEKGESLYNGSAKKQIYRTFRNMEALVSAEGVTLHNIKQATVYFKRPEDFESYQKIFIQRINKEMPYVCMLAEICRPELLFEIEAVLNIEHT